MSTRRASSFGTVLGWLICALLLGCDGGTRSDQVAVPGVPGAMKTIAAVRAHRRAYDGAPPVIPHAPFGDCLVCHKAGGTPVAGIGFAPPNPHAAYSEREGTFARCYQCHVHQNTEALFVATSFQGRPQDLRHGNRAHEAAPPVIPHDTFLRRDCQACHTGPAAREELRCTHPERTRCQQCHVPSNVDSRFRRP